MVVAIAQMCVTDSNLCTAHVCVDVQPNVRRNLLLTIEIFVRYYAVVDWSTKLITWIYASEKIYLGAFFAIAL